MAGDAGNDAEPPRSVRNTAPRPRSPEDGVLCYAAGTHIRTENGEVPVEALRAGDRVLTVHGGPLLQPLAWVGRMRVNVARHRDRSRVAPILFRPGALGDGVPHRALRVSPEHAIFIGGRLVPARLLANGTSIVQECWCQEIDYHHIELDRHGLVVAEGTVSETYLDEGNRYLFDNGDIVALTVDYGALRGNGRYGGSVCAPVLGEGSPALEIIRGRLAALVRTTG